MQLVKKLEIQSKHKIIEFLNSEPVGRIASIDANGYPQVIPMNFVYVQANDPLIRPRRITKLDAVYMHSHPFGEKIDNIKGNSKVGFEVDRHVCFYLLTIFILVTLRKLILSILVWLSKETQ